MVVEEVVAGRCAVRWTRLPNVGADGQARRRHATERRDGIRPRRRGSRSVGIEQDFRAAGTVELELEVAVADRICPVISGR